MADVNETSSASSVNGSRGNPDPEAKREHDAAIRGGKADPDDRGSGLPVGSDASAAQHFAGKGDFGIPVADAAHHMAAADEAKYQPAGDHLTDPRPGHSGSDGTRTSGVGGNASGDGSSSGGDLDPDIIGFRTGRSENVLPAQSRARSVRPPEIELEGSTVNRSGGDASTTDSGQGASSVSPAFDTGDDASAGEISQGEAGGEDN